MIKKNLIFAFLLMMLSVSISYSQIDSTEITSSVPELTKFHDVIYLIWHEAFPSNDIAKLKSYVPDIQTHISNINNAKLPGILREKEMKWREGLVDLNKTVEDYYNAAKGTDDQAMLDAAEKLHSKFEMMVRILRPVLKEVDDYHKILYIIYHKYTPEKKYSEIESVMDDLIAKADALGKVPEDKLQKRIPNKIADYNKAVKELYESTVTLKDILKTNDSPQIDKAIDNMHSKYQKLESVFD
jgi:hypothetical protein